MAANIAAMSLDRLRRAIRKNRISFPSQVPVFPHQPKPDVQWRLVALFFVHNRSCTDLGPRYGLSANYVRELISRWVQRAVSFGYLQEIPATPAAMPEATPTEEVHADLRRARDRSAPGGKPLRPTRLRRLSFGRVTLDVNTHTITAARRKIDLTPNEWAILAKLASQVNRTVPRSELINVLVGAPLDPRGAVRHFIVTSRGKLEPDSAHPQYLITERAVGYRLRVPTQRSPRQSAPRA